MYKEYILMYKSPDDSHLHPMNVSDYEYLMNIGVECVLFDIDNASYSKFNKNDKNIDIMLGVGDFVHVKKYFNNQEEKITIWQILLCILFWFTVFEIYCFFSK